MLLHDVLPWIAQEAVVHQLLATLRRWLRPGSAISITHATADLSPSQMDAVIAVWARANVAFRPRTVEEIRTLFGNWPVLEPGVVPTARWHAEHPHAGLPPQSSAAYAGIALAPSRSDDQEDCR